MARRSQIQFATPTAATARRTTPSTTGKSRWDTDCNNSISESDPGFQLALYPILQHFRTVLANRRCRTVFGYAHKRAVCIDDGNIFRSKARNR